MSCKNRLFYIFIFFFGFFTAFGQDLIIQKTGTKIYCKIVSEDSALIYYKLPSQNMQFQIRKMQVEKYYVSNKVNQKKDDKETKSGELLFLNFYGGYANAMNEFASKDLTKETSGLANDGSLFRTSLVLNLSENFGFTGSYIYQTHSFEDKLLRDELNLYYSSTSFTSRSTKWKIHGFFGGLHLSFPIKRIEHFSICFETSFGLPKLVSPDVETSGSPFGQKVTVTQYSSVTKAIAFLGGVGLNYKLAKNLALNFNVSHFRSKAEFSHILTRSTNGYQSYSDYEQKISSLNIEAGLRFIIYQKGY
jgi:hypothetical protein